MKEFKKTRADLHASIYRTKFGEFTEDDRKAIAAGRQSTTGISRKIDQLLAEISKPEIRAMIFTRDGYKCKHCQKRTMLTIDHIIPVAKGGSDHPDNLQTLCKRCNSKKGAKV